MIVRKNGFTLDVDLENTIKYSREHSICNCDEDRNFYVQSKEKFPKLAEFLSELGLLIDRPDEIGSYAEEDYIDYHFVSYTAYMFQIPDLSRQSFPPYLTSNENFFPLTLPPK